MPKKLSDQVKEHAQARSEVSDGPPEFDGSVEQVISTGSTLLDLAISGGRVRGGGIPKGILVEIFGPPSAGKTILLCEIAGSVQRQGGRVMFRDPEARLNKSFARLFGLNPDEIDYGSPSTVMELFAPIRKWKPEPPSKIHGIFADSLAALSTEWEMEDRDTYGMRRAKEFSEQCRLTCRILAERGFLMVCSNQVRQNVDGGPYAPKYRTPGGEAIGFYASLRLRLSSPKKIKVNRQVKGKTLSKAVGIAAEAEVFKSSVWEPFHTAPVYLLFDYGIDDIRANLMYLKKYTGATQYVVGGEKVGSSIEEAIARVEADGLEESLRQEVIDLWSGIEEKFRSNRKPRNR